jgi:tripartite-type tricarboxylate transporter receptor subunit TctC
MSLRRRSFAIAAAGALSLFATAVSGQSYPSRPITIVVPLAAGGAVDVLARNIGEHMSKTLGQPVIVENTTGAGGSVGVARVARAAPDGYTLGTGTASQYVGSAAIYPVQYDLLRDFAPVAMWPSVPYWLVAKKDLPANDLKSLIAWLKANPDKATAGAVGVGMGSHLCGLMFQQATGTRFQMVPYRGGAPALQDLAGGQIDLMCDLAGNSLSQAKAGRIKPIAVFSKGRWFAAPDVPTGDEAGMPDFYVSTWHALWAPAGTPQDIIAKLNAAVVAAYADETVRKRIADQGMEIPTREQLTPEALGAYHKSEVEKWVPIIKAQNIKPD